MKDHYVKIQFLLIINYLIYRLHEEFFEMFFFYFFKHLKKSQNNFLLKFRLRFLLKVYFNSKHLNATKKKHFLNYYIALK